MQEVDINPSEHEHPEEAEASEEPGCVPGTLQESSDPEPNTDGGLQPACITDGADPRHMVMEEVVSDQELQQTQLVHSFGSSVQVQMVQRSSESKS